MCQAFEILDLAGYREELMVVVFGGVWGMREIRIAGVDWGNP